MIFCIELYRIRGISHKKFCEKKHKFIITLSFKKYCYYYYYYILFIRNIILETYFEKYFFFPRKNDPLSLHEASPLAALQFQKFVKLNE